MLPNMIRENNAPFRRRILLGAIQGDSFSVAEGSIKSWKGNVGRNTALNGISNVIRRTASSLKGGYIVRRQIATPRAAMAELSRNVLSARDRRTPSSLAISTSQKSRNAPTSSTECALQLASKKEQSTDQEPAFTMPLVERGEQEQQQHADPIVARHCKTSG